MRQAVNLTDTRLRELERRWRESGAPEDEAGFLCERVRVGDLSEARLRAARLVGYVPAQLALAGRAEGSVTRREMEGELADALATVGTSACISAVLTLAEAAATSVRGSLPEEAAAALSWSRELAGGAPVGADLGATLRSLVDMALPRTTEGKRVRAAVDLVRIALCASAYGRRVARASLRSAIERAEVVLPAPLTVLRTTFAPRFLYTDWPIERQAVRLVVVEERFQIKGAGTVIQPGVNLELPAAGQLSFVVEVRDGGVVHRCLAKATIPLTQPPARRPLHVLVLPLPKALLPVDSVIWEVGP